MPHSRNGSRIIALPLRRDVLDLQGWKVADLYDSPNIWAIADYNDNAPSSDDRWYIGSVTLSSVSGCNRQAIGNWVKNHHHIVDDHNNKYGLGQYHNKRHKGVEITDLVKLWEKD